MHLANEENENVNISPEKGRVSDVTNHNNTDMALVRGR